MPLEENLNRYSGQSRNTNKNFSESASLIEDATKVLGAFLVNFFYGRLPGQRNQYNANHFKNALLSMGSFLLTIEPGKSDNSEIFLPKMTKNLDYSIIRGILKANCDPHILESDLYSQKECETRLTQLPEYLQLSNAYSAFNKEEFKKLMTFHPQLIVMGMDPEFRALGAIAVQRALNDERIILPSTKLPQKIYSYHLKCLMSGIIPQTNDFVEAAKEYGILDIGSAIEAFSIAHDRCLQEW